jgi:ABC-2 type transport system permease protein
VSLWKLEWQRLIRTKRWITLLAVFVLFGFVGPLVAKYLAQILTSKVGGGMKIITAPPTPADGLASFARNAQQVGLIVVAAVAAGALAFDARSGLATFYRTRVRSLGQLLLPRYVMNFVAAVVAYSLGTLAAWYETSVLIGGLSAAAIFNGLLLQVVFIAFAVAVVGLCASLVRNTVTVVAISAAVFLLIPVLQLFTSVSKWLPSALLQSQSDIARGATLGSYGGAVIVTLLLTACLLAVSSFAFSRREL